MRVGIINDFEDLTKVEKPALLQSRLEKQAFQEL